MAKPAACSNRNQEKFIASPELTELQQETLQPLPTYRSIILAVDASDHSNRGAAEAASLGELWGSTVTGAHVYATKLHDQRFRQMEGGLPEQYREEQELEKQREIHDDLITKGLSVITDSYLDQVEETCRNKGIDYQRAALEGKNYRELVREANSGGYDLLVMGSLGLGAVPGARIGTVCERVARRSEIDTLVIKNPKRSITEGPLMVAVDGSTRSYGGLLTALSLARSWQLPVHVVSAFDPYYHYVAFNRIAGVLSEEAGKVFRFKEQEKLHEDIIDAGLAKIYQGHLDVAQSIAQDYGIEIETELLAGKPYVVIEKHVSKIQPSLLVLGKTGIHADDELDIGGNAENLLRNVGCAVLLSRREHQPRVDVIAEATTSWTRQAEERLNKVPSFARGMARMGVIRYAQEMGHTVVTEKIVDAATKNLCPVKHGEFDRADQVDGDSISDRSASTAVESKFRLDWSPEADLISHSVSDESIRDNLRLRAEKKARQQGSEIVDAEHIMALMDVKQVAAGEGSTCPFGFKSTADNGQQVLAWTSAAKQRLERIPAGFMRKLTRQRVEIFARARDATEVTTELMGKKYQQWGEGSEKQAMTMPWSNTAQKKIDRIPDFIRGMVIKEVESWATRLNLTEITPEVISKASDSWASSGQFHTDTDPGKHQA